MFLIIIKSHSTDYQISQNLYKSMSYKMNIILPQVRGAVRLAVTITYVQNLG